MCNFGRGHYEKHFCEIILNLDRWLTRSRLKIFLFLAQAGILLSRVEWFVNFCRWYYEEYFCEIILNLGQWLRRRHLKITSIFFSSGGHFVRWSRTICAILVEGIMGNIHVNSYNLERWFRRRCLKKVYGQRMKTRS